LSFLMLGIYTSVGVGDHYILEIINYNEE